MWPSGMDRLGVPVKGKIPPAEANGSGRALARLTDLGWGGRLREVFGTDAPDREVPAGMLKACVQVLAQWGWAQRPVAVVNVPSRSRPLLVQSLARGLSDIGRLPYLGELAIPHGGPRGGPGGNSAFRLADVWDQFHVPDGGEAWLAQNRGPVLLVDDLADSRWTTHRGRPRAAPGRGGNGAALRARAQGLNPTRRHRHRRRKRTAGAWPGRWIIVVPCPAG